MFADGEGRKDAANPSDVGRARDNRLVHVAVPKEPQDRPRPGDMAEWSSPTPRRTISTPTPDSSRCIAPAAATRGKPPVCTRLARNRSRHPYGRRPWYVTAHSTLTAH